MSVLWLDGIPPSWRVSRLSRWFAVSLGKMLDEAKFADSDGDVLPYVRAGNIRDGALELTDVKAMPFTAHEQRKFELRAGDLLVVEGGSIGLNVRLTIDMPGWGYQKTVNRVRSRSNASTAFLGYQLGALRARGVFDTISNVSTIQHLTAEKLERLTICMPPAAQQWAIADYLDRETAQIDAFIAKNEQLIALLTERRMSVITEAVIGADTARLLAPLRHVATVLDCKHVTAEPATGDDSFAVASVREVGGHWVNVENARRTTQDSYRSLGEGGRTLRPWDLLVCRNTSVGKVAIVPPGIEPTVMGQDVSLIRTKGSDRNAARFLHYALTSAVGIDRFEQASIGSTFKRINVDDIKALKLPHVASDIARQVSDRLDYEAGQIDEAIQAASCAIDLARERRAALISAAVTGKLDIGAEHSGPIKH